MCCSPEGVSVSARPLASQCYPMCERLPEFKVLCRGVERVGEGATWCGDWVWRYIGHCTASPVQGVAHVAPVK